MNYFLALLFIAFVFLIGIIPFSIIYVVSDLIRFFLFRVFKYRRIVVEKNLRESFPDRSEKEIQELVSKFYTNLSDVLIEGIKAFTMTRKQIIERHYVVNPEIVDQFNKEGRSIIAVPCHYGNWEWGSMSGSLQLPQQNVVFYKPLSNKTIDRFVRWSRAKYDSKLVSIYITARVFIEYAPQNSVFIMASDQSPSNIDKAYWVKFLGRDTAFLHGPEVYARKFNLPVVFVDIQRKRRGFYELELSIISDDSTKLKEGEITQRYAKKLETAILNKPENWLWSHRRWKHSKE